MDKANNSNNSNSNWPIIVHCHLRWDGVWQRPQQFLSRLSLKHPVLFVEGPILVEGDRSEAKLYQAPKYPNITILQPFIPKARFHDGVWVDRERHRLVQEALAREVPGNFRAPVQWFYDPMAVTAFAGKMNERAIVYDCMDELSQFKFAPPEIVSRERELLAQADVVFTGGRRMCQSKSRFNDNCHFYGCGVEVSHFGKARSQELEVPEELRQLNGPVLGYFGVVDERLDYELIAALVAANSDWHVVMVGPVVKVDPASLPQHPRLHWLGRREYADLPAYTKGFAVCLMPFALNEATEYINPTKALEYMATGKPIVSTAVSDVVANFGSVVKVARSQEQFIEFCQREVKNPDGAAISAGLRMAAENEWDVIVQALESHVEEALMKKEKSAPSKPLSLAPA